MSISLRWRAASARGATVTAVLALAVTGAAAAPATARAPAAASPNPSSLDNELHGVSAVSGSNAWAVGEYYNTTTKVYDTLILHWNGTTWTQVPSPSPGTDNILNGVSAVSASNAWAVGEYYTATGGPDTPYTLILHWNGTTWTQVPSPSPSPGKSELDGVSAVSGGDAWAVGDYFDTATNVDQTLILHWNGTAWTRVPSPSPAGSNALSGVSADSGSDAWAVGVNADKTLTLHWNGTAWTQVPSPNPSSMVNRLSAVSALSSSNAWAVGDYYQSNKVTYKTLILHWNGTAWTPAYSPSPGIDGNALSGVSAVSGSNAWAVGDYVNRINGVEVAKTLILHWNGTAWREAASPNPSSRSNVLLGVSADLASDAWAVGDYVYVNVNNRFVNRTLILHWNGTAWVRT